MSMRSCAAEGLNWRCLSSAVVALGAFVLLSVSVAAEGTPAQSGEEQFAKVGVSVENRSEPVLCAEKDNVSLMLSHAGVTSFRIEAAHPVYINMLQKDSFAPDWTNCDFAGEAKAQPAPEKFTLYEDVSVWVVGFRFAEFWRDRKVPVRIGDVVRDDLHLIQVWVRHEERAEEVLVLYPTDGYWRARPLPPKHLGWSAYGSSFLVGPVEDAGRPVVNFSEIRFDPKSLSFDMRFAGGGGSASLKIAKLNRDVQVIDVAFAKPIQGPPFAALRSMYITRFNNDVADVAVQPKGARSWQEAPVMKFGTAQSVLELWAGRLSPSRHNTSSPDHVFRDFKVPAAPVKPAKVEQR